MLRVKYKSLMLSVVMLNDIVLSVVVPWSAVDKQSYTVFWGLYC
jgi:hypothetical protein